MSKVKPASYTKSAKSDQRSINILKNLLLNENLFSQLSENDKTPNYDGYITILGEDSISIGRIEVQVKTLRKNYKSPTFSVKLNFLAHVRDSFQLPIILVAVDQTNNKAFWKEIDNKTASDLIDKALEKKKDSIAIQFDIKNEISKNSPYESWKSIIETHRDRWASIVENEKKLIKTQELIQELITNHNDQNPYYSSLHKFLDKLDDLFSNDFKVVKNLFVRDFWKFGIAVSEISDTRLTYSLFTIDWDENQKQIIFYQDSTGESLMEKYGSLQGYNSANPILESPQKHAYKHCQEYLKLLLDRDILWPNDTNLENEYLFYIRDSYFKGNEQFEPSSINLLELKQKIENYLNLVPFEKETMQNFPYSKRNLFRGLDYIQNFRMTGKKVIKRITPSQKAIRDVPISVGERNQFPDDIIDMVKAYWTTYHESYTNLINEYFPAIKHEIDFFKDFDVLVVVPVIETRKFNSSLYNTPICYLRKLKDPTGRTSKKVVIEKNENCVIRQNGVNVLYKRKKFVLTEWKVRRFSEMRDELPVRNEVFILIKERLEDYFNKRVR